MSGVVDSRLFDSHIANMLLEPQPKLVVVLVVLVR